MQWRDLLAIVGLALMYSHSAPCLRRTQMTRTCPTIDVTFAPMVCSHTCPDSRFSLSARCSRRTQATSTCPQSEVRCIHSFIIVPGVYIRTMLGGQLNDIHTCAAGCHMQWCFFKLLTEPPSVYPLTFESCEQPTIRNIMMSCMPHKAA